MDNLFRNLYKRLIRRARARREERARREQTRREERTARRTAAARLEAEITAALQQEDLAWTDFLESEEESLAQIMAIIEQTDNLELMHDRLQQRALQHASRRQLQLTQQERNEVVRSAAIYSLFQPIDIGELDADSRNCVICYDAYGDGEDGCPVPVRLGCCAPATVGRTCLIVWLLERGTCPLYRRDWRGEINRVVEEFETK